MDNKPVVIYVHCEAGVDRTGEFCGSYSMAYKNMTFADVRPALGLRYPHSTQALTYANSVEPREIRTPSRNGMQWFCLYLKFGLNQSDRDCTLPSQ